MEITTDLTCIYCLRLPKLNDIFIAKVDADGYIQISKCLDCQDSDTPPEKVGGWIVCKRSLNGWMVQDIDGEFTLELFYFSNN